MEFWGVEVKSGQPLEVKLDEMDILHLSQANLGEIKNKTNESVCLFITIGKQKLVLGTLNSERLPQQIFDLVIDKDFQLSHNSKNSSVYFYGYKADKPFDDDDSLCYAITKFDDSDEDTDEEEEASALPIANGKQETKKEDQVVAKKKDGKQKVKIVEPEKDKKADEDDDSDSDSGDSASEDSDSDSEKDDLDSSDSEDSSDEEEETPKKSGKKRPNESAMKTPASSKKAKTTTPQKTDGKKAVHVATPHPSKQTKTPANKSNQKTPASVSTDGAHSCKPCNRTFKSESALQSHNQAKHK